jgi:ACS family sodium-dependent inorganic phosphate cotransporter
VRVEFNENNNVADNSIRPIGAIRSARQSPVWLVSLTVIAVYICFIDRIAISIAIIPMAAENAWSASTQGAIMAAFFLGYLTLQIPAGLLADRFVGKWVLGLGVLLWSVFTLLTPPAAAAGLVTLVACRFFMGVAEAVTWPSIYSLYSQW